MSHLFTTSAIVLNSIDYGESDRIINLYTKDYGKIGGIAKGAKRSKKRFVNCLEPFSYIKVIFAKKQHTSLARIDQCELINNFHNIKSSLETIAAGSYFIELLSEMVREGQKNLMVFELILNFLKYLNEGKEPETLSRFFEIRLLSLLGYKPVLDRCVACKNLIDSKVNPVRSLPDEGNKYANEVYASNKEISNGVKIYFSSSKGGIICESCAAPAETRLPISLGTAKSISLAVNASLEGLNRLTLSSHIKNESAYVLDDFIRYQLGKELKSKRFMEKIKM